MKKVMITALIFALSGSALCAQAKHPTLSAEQLNVMSPALKSLVNKVQGQVLADAPLPAELNTYIKATQAAVKKDRLALEAIMKEKGWDPGAASIVQLADALLNQIDATLVTLTGTGQTIANNVSSVDSYIAGLNSYVPPAPTKFPEKCVIYKDQPRNDVFLECAQIEPLAGKTACTALVDGKTQQYTFAPDVGSTATGEESTVRNGANIKVYLQYPPKITGANNAVQCVVPPGS